MVEMFSKNIASGHERLVVAGGIGDVEVIALCAVPFGEHAVEYIGDLRVHVRTDGLLGPCRVYLGRGHILDVVRERHGDILRVLGRRTEVHRDGFGDGNIGFGQNCPSFYGFSGRAGSRACGVPVAVRSVGVKLWFSLSGVSATGSMVGTPENIAMCRAVSGV